MIRFDGLKLMEMLRDKRLMFVGDSIQRGMFESMVCLVQSAIPSPGKTSLQRIPPRKVFKVEVLICPPKSFMVQHPKYILISDVFNPRLVSQPTYKAESSSSYAVFEFNSMYY